ncbi:MAG: hypothetical protein QNK17_04740 [Hyphomicrobiaceae bacterium]|nr:hypothetical protein [Hyphomicrobiaceae bacterium]MDX2449722.1 hypothetical protein [Hyphomicrobiaceae bacterium]
MRDYLKTFAGIVVAVLVPACLAGCGGGGGSSGMSGLLSGASGIFGSSPKLTVAPIIGAPENVGSELTKALIAAGKDRNLTITPGTSGEEYVLRGYLIAAPERRGSKISYIWDVTDAKGTRVTRVSGEEMVAKGSPSKPWSGVDSTVTRTIAAKTTSQLAAKLPGGRSGSTASVAAAAPAAAAATTASAPARPAKAGPAKVLVAPVNGAPGDGRRSLTTALKKRLYKGGIKLANGATGRIYTVKGTVKLTSASGGKESIRISWQVFDPNGKALGTVTQKNNIPKGSLNGPWGAIADAAAGAAADGIIKLLPKSS